MRKTCDKSEYLEINPEIFALAEKMLSEEEIRKAEEIAVNLVKKSTRIGAQNSLKEILGYRPKRPIYYANHEIGHLPRWTRYAIENLGHFVDILVKCVASEKLANPKCNEYSFGANLVKLKNKIPDDLYNELDKFNRLIYRPAKHDFKPINRSHRFTSKEVVFKVFFTLKFKEKMIAISQEAKDYCEDKTPY